jgi:hypothetical protein
MPFDGAVFTHTGEMMPTRAAIELLQPNFRKEKYSEFK